MIVDMPKVTQMLDSGWVVTLVKNNLGSYTAAAKKPEPKHSSRRSRVIVTDDFTPEHALTRLAYKVHGDVI